MKKKYLLAPAFFLTLFTSCQNVEQSQLNMTSWDISAGSSSSEKLSEIVHPDYLLIPLETSSESLVSKIDKVVLHEDKIYILDGFSEARIKVFDTSGNFLQTIGKTGEGPGEYRNPVDFFLKDGFIFIYDNPDNLLKYTLAGDFVDSERTGISGFRIEPNQDHGFAMIDGGTSSNLVTTDEQFGQVQSFFPYRSRFVDQIILYPLIKTPNGDLLYRRFLNDTIFKIEKNGFPVPHLFIDHGDKAFSLKKDWGDKAINDDELENLTSNYSVNQLYLENDSHQLVFYFSSMSPFFAVRNKETNNSKVFDFLSFENDITLTPNFAFTHASGGYFIGVVDPAAVFMDNKPVESYPDKMRSVFSQLEDGDNPILLLAKFK
ncbi:MAG: 6-bladed beta-propeller [Bacteroidota bacterium]